MTAWKCEHCGRTLATLNERGEFILARAMIHGDKRHGLRLICPYCQWRNAWQKVDNAEHVLYNATVE